MKIIFGKYLFFLFNKIQSSKICIFSERIFRTATVEYVNHLVSQGKLKIEKIKAHHVVIPGGIKFMKFLLKVIVLVVNEILVRKKATNMVVETKKTVGEYICKDLLEKSDFVSALGVELRKIVTEDITAIKKKTEMIDMAIGSVFDGVQEVSDGDRKEFFDAWSTVNFNHFQKTQMEQKDMRRVITSFARICKQGKNLLKPQEFSQSRYNSECVKDAIKIVKDKIGFEDESETEITSRGYTNISEVIKLIRRSIEHVIYMIIQYPLRDFNDIKADAMVVNELFTKTMHVSSEIKFFLKKLSEEESNLQKTDVSIQNIRDPQLFDGFFGTPPIALNTKEAEDLSMLHMPFGRLGTRDVTRMNVSQSRLLQISQRELLFSPKLERSILGPPKQSNFLNQARPNKRQFQINSASLFASKDKTPNISRLESYSMVMPGSGHVLSSTVLDQTIRNQTPPSLTVTNVRQSMSARKSNYSDFPTQSPLNETQIHKNVPEKNTPKHFLTPQPKRLSIKPKLSPKIQLNDETITSPHVHEKTSGLLTTLTKSSSPSSRVKIYSGRPLLSNDSSSTTISDSSLLALSKRTLTIEPENDNSPNTIEIFSKFNNMNISEEKENLFDTSGTMLVDDSM